MRFAKFKILFLSALLFLTVLPGGFAAEEPWTDKFFNEFAQIKNRMDEFEKAQDSLIKREDQVLKEIDQIRKWVAHRPNKHP